MFWSADQQAASRHFPIEPAEPEAPTKEGQAEVGRGADPTGPGGGAGSRERPGHLDVLGLYLKEISRLPLLSPEEEKEAARAVFLGERARRLLARKELPEHKRQKLHQRAQEGELARTLLVHCNLRLVVSVARRYLGRGLSLADLIQEGNIGLLRAARRFDYRKGFRFSTYATWWVRQAILQALGELGLPVRLPAHVRTALGQARDAEARLAQRLGREATCAEVALEMTSTLQEPADAAGWVGRLRNLMREPISLDAPVCEDDPRPLSELLAETLGESIEDVLSKAVLAAELTKLLSQLAERERQVLYLRYGLGGLAPLNLTEVARAMGLSRERVRQLEAQALKKLRRCALRAGLQGFLP